MAYTSDDLAGLESALASGEHRVRFSDGREVEYRSVDDLKKAIGTVSASLATSAGTKKVRTVKVTMEPFC